MTTASFWMDVAPRIVTVLIIWFALAVAVAATFIAAVEFARWREHRRRARRHARGSIVVDLRPSGRRSA